MRLLIGCVLALGFAESARSPVEDSSCAARQSFAGPAAIEWLLGPLEDRQQLDEWCRGVGPPFVAAAANASDPPPRLDELVVVTWNAHLAEGRVAALLADLRAGRLTGGRPVRHFVLLLQEMFRRGPAVPEFAVDARSAIGIVARDPAASDVGGYAGTLGLATLYVPSMRNGATLREDRGNAIFSTEPLHDLRALELPFERQRRVAIGASLVVGTQHGRERLVVLNVHLEPLSKPSSLWFFHNPRRRQVDAVLSVLQQSSTIDVAATVLGGDFNTIQGGPREDAYRQARAWSRGLEHEDRRSTHDLGRLDYLFVRLADDWRAVTSRVDDKYGSDHHPVLARFHAIRTGH